jgi:hypothetical protein
VNRIQRNWQAGAERDLLGQPVRRVRVLRTSNAYTFNDPKPSKSDFPTGTAGSSLNLPSVEREKKDRTPLRGELARGLAPDTTFLAKLDELDRSIRASQRAADGRVGLAAEPKS